MKLSNVPEGSRIKTLEDYLGPPGEPMYPKGMKLKFSHMDGMYSVCFDDKGSRVYLYAFSEVEII